MIVESISEKILDEILSNILEKIKNIVVTSYTKLTDSMPQVFSQEDVNKIIKEAFENARKCNYLKDIDKEELELLISDNAELIYTWIIDEQQFNSELLKLQNDEQKKKHITFLHQIFHFIRISRNSYLSFSTERVLSKLDVLKMQSNAVSNQLDRIETKLEWSFSKELETIESKIKDRLSAEAISFLEALEIKILQSRNDEEIEKFYQLYTEAYLINSENQQKALPYLNKLISYTTDNFLKWYRRALYKIIDNKFDEVKTLLNEYQLDKLEGKSKQLYFSIKINYLMLTKQISEVEQFLEDEKDNIDDYFQWVMSLFLSQGLYEKAVKQIDLCKEEDSKKIVNKVLICQAKVFFYIERMQLEGKTENIRNSLLDVVNDIDNTLKQIHEDRAREKTLLLLKGMIFQNINKIDEAFSMYQKIEELGGSDDPNFLRNYAMIFMLKANYEKSLDYVKKALEIIPEDTLCLEIYYSTMCIVNPEKAAKELQDFKETEGTLDIKLKIIDALVRQDKIKTAEEMLKEFEYKYPENSDVIFASAELECLKGKLDNAIELYRKIIARNVKNPLYIASIRKLLQIGLNQRNLILLSELIQITNIEENIMYEYLSIIGYEIIYAFILLGNIIKAHSIVKKMEEYNLITNDILRLDMSCQFHSKNYEKAIEIYNNLKANVQIFPEDRKIYLYSLYYLGKRDDLLEAIDVMPTPCNPNEYIAQSQTIRNLGVFEKAIKIAHDAYVKYPDNQYVVENFIQMIFTRGMEQIDDNIIKDFYKCRDIYFANPNSTHSFKVIQLPTDAKGEDILRILNDNLPKQKKIDYLNFLNEHHFHISILAKKFNYFFMWKNVIELPQYKIFLSDCSVPDLKRQYDNISEKDVIIDLPSLITCAYLDILQYLAQFFAKIFISQDSIDVLERAKNSQYNVYAENSMSGLYELNNYSYPDKKIDYSDLREYLNRIDRFRGNNNVRVVGSQLEPKSQLQEDLVNFLEKAEMLETSDVLYACSSNIQIMLESYVMRVAMKELKSSIIPFEIETILLKLVKTGKMNAEHYFAAIYKLLKAKYYCVYFDFNFIIYYLERNNYSDSEETDFLQSLFISDAYIKDWMASILTNVILKIFITKENDDNTISFVLTWINNILKNRKDFSFNERLLLFKSLYTAIPNESIKQIIYQVWEKDNAEGK